MVRSLRSWQISSNFTHAYSLMSLNFVLVFLLSGWLLSEPMTMQKTIAIGLIIRGTLLVARG
jgi:uncharacterized membrane protein